MAKHKANIFLRTFLFAIVLLVVCSVSIAWWLSSHYKQIITERLPEIITKSSDSVYYISFSDIEVSLFTHQVKITGIKLWCDEKQAQELRRQHRHAPITLSNVSIPYAELDGIMWKDLITSKSLDCKNAVIRGLKWSMACTPHPEDSLFTHDKNRNPVIGRISAGHVDFIDPDITYHYKGSQSTFDCYMKGGTARLNNWAYNYDQTKDTSTFLFARSGKVRFNTFILSKPAGRYVVKSPDLDFETNDTSVTLRLVKIYHLADYDQHTTKEKENYDLSFPTIELSNFNWNRLINNGVLRIPKVNAISPNISARYIRENNPGNSRTGSYPNQLLLQVGLKTNIMELNIKNGHFKYTEVTKKGDEGIIEFTGINGAFHNITNLPKVIAKHNSCIVALEGKFMNKSPISARFDLSLADSNGRFKVDGYLKDLSGDEVTPQAQVFTIVKVTSFHLNTMDMHIEGDQSYSKGDFTVLYNDLKISLFKFDTKHREGKKGTLAFIGSTLLLYTDNPLPDKEVRKVSTSFARDTAKGFIGTIWQNMYRAAKKTAVREKALVTIMDGPETNKGQKPKKGFFTRLFGKKKNS